MRPEGVVVVGAGGHAKVVIATLRAAGIEVLACYDDAEQRRGTEVLGVEVVGPVESLPARPGHGRAVLAIGDNAARAAIASRLDGTCEWAAAAHPSAIVHESVVVGPGTVVFAGAVVQPETVLGAHVVVNTSASIDHDCVVGDYAHLAPGVHLAGGVAVGTGAFCGVGVVAVPGAQVGAWSVVGAGAAIIEDVPAGSVAVGVPARALERNGL